MIYQAHTSKTELNKTRYDSDAIKAGIDLRDIVQQFWGAPKRKTSKRSTYFAHWRQDGHTPSFSVERDHYKDFGGAGESGDVFSFLQRELNTDFRGALEWAANHKGIIVENAVIITPVAQPASEPTTAEWQAEGHKFIAYSEAWLWSDRKEAKRVLQYLRHDRGLTDETIKARKLGYNPQWVKLGNIGKAAPGIVIPYLDQELSAIRIRCRVGKLATALGIQADIGRDGDELPKYLNVAGSRVTGTLYNSANIQPGLGVLFVEGEFDAILAHQEISDLVNVVTLGAATNRLTVAHKERLQAADEIYLTLDDDEAGQGATRQLKETLRSWGKTPQVLKLPSGKDVCEFVAEQWNDLHEWFLNKTVFWWEGGAMPDAYREAMFNYMPNGVAMLADIINRAMLAGRINPKGFSITQLWNAASEQGFSIPQQTFYKAFDYAKTVLFSILGIEYSVLNTIPNFENNSYVTGRKADLYRVVSPAALLRTVEEHAYYRLYEHYHPTEGNAVISPLQLGMVDAIETTENKDDLALELAAEIDNAAQRQDDQKLKLSAYFKTAYSRFRATLEDMTSTPLPAWEINNPRDYVTAYARAVGETTVDRRISLNEWSRKLGVSVNAVPDVIKRAGLGKVNQPQWEYVQVDIAENIAAVVAGKARALKAYPRFIVVRDQQNNEITSEEYNPDTAQKRAKEMRVMGCKVEVKMQAANRYEVVSQTPVEVHKPVPERAAPVDRANIPAEPEFEIVRPFRERRFNPAWVANQFRLVLQKQNKWLKGWEFVGLNDDIVVTRDCRELAELIIGRPIENANSFDVLAVAG